MATNEQPSGTSSGVPDLQTSSQPGGLGTSGRDQARGARRRSSTFRRATHNVENFGRNRSSHRENIEALFSHRARTRGLARIEAERRQQQETSPADGGIQSNTNSQGDDTTEGATEGWKPSIVLGSSLWVEGEDLNALEIADRKVAQTRLWADHYRGVPYFVKAHQDAIEERGQLDESAEENTKPRSTLKSTHDSAIQDRLEILRFLLQDSSFPPERKNIEAAIAGYESGAIPYSDSYTLLWAGHIVDRCPSFDSFTNDRSARLDRYVAEHGPGWLWYEPPLSAGSGTMRGPTIVAKKGFCLESKHSWRQGTENMGHYNIRMGFRRRKDNVARGGAQQQQSPFTTHHTSRVTTSQPPNHHHPAPGGGLGGGGPTTLPPSIRTQTIPQPDTSLPGKTTPDPDGPRIIWNMLLDSGATLPTLWTGDLPKLGIDATRYAAQSARRVNTADSSLVSRVYELDVRVFGGDESAPLGLFPPPSGPRHPTYGVAGAVNDTETETDDEEEPPSLSCTIPVLVFPGGSKDLSTSSDANVPDRLSGLLPFHVCYLSGAPGSFKLWMGEDRVDVLGTGRLPAMMRYGEILGGGGGGGATQEWERAKRLPASTATRLTHWRSQGLKTPDRVIFEHDLDADGVLREEDVGHGNVIMRGPKGANFDNTNTKAEGVVVLHIGRKRRRGQQDVRRRGSVVSKPPRKKTKIEQTGHGQILLQTQAPASDYPSPATCCTVRKSMVAR
ncbi:hypothetical protein C8A01DRAFT_16211 [Parachaetomium inaequale]|uniref:Uncharacterized protein n=1 Tax=Parachaetomium inaequale TaxID=2588326 RepID=A0AAN6PFB4_9PEZI|nr:hypothetical protein C8A01DRAFT_16211 [Parachaetomium inaequale]